MPALLRTLLDFLETYRPALTAPSFANSIVIFVGWVCSSGAHAVTEALVVTGVSGRRHHEAFHRFFSRGTWKPDEIGRLLFAAVLRLVGAATAPICIVVDDTLAPKKGAHVFGIGSHLDAVRSTRRHLVFCFGHCWVVLAVMVPVPFSQRVWALPILFRLYRNKKECVKKKQRYRKKTELARDMVDVFVSWVGERRVVLTADSAYCNNTVTKGLPGSVVLLGAMRPDAVLTGLPSPRGGVGRPRLRGEKSPKPTVLATDERKPWRTCKATLYGRKTKVAYKDCFAQWYRACGLGLLHIVVVKVESGAIPFRVFFSTDPALSVQQILEGYAGRWSIEVCFKDLKQHLGFADSSARKREAVERTAPFVGYIYTTLVLWFADTASKSPVAAPPIRPWYRHKRGFSFADILRTAQRVLAHADVLDPARSLANLQKSDAARVTPADRRRAAAHQALARAA
jgi:hypothetical protein